MTKRTRRTADRETRQRAPDRGASRRTPDRGPADREPSSGPAWMSRRLRRRLGLLALVVVAALVTALILRPWSRPVADPALALADAAMLDSLKAADARRDWVAAVDWAERLAVRHPRDPALLLARATAWSNFGVAQRPMRTRMRPALRTSLERIACQRRAFTLADSAAMAARDDAAWVRAMTMLGEMEETLGLPGDALIVYEMIKQRKPDETPAALRAYWLRALLYDPVDPDTSAWDAYQRRIGKR